jgi:hypothetical protein
MPDEKQTHGEHDAGYTMAPVETHDSYFGGQVKIIEAVPTIEHAGAGQPDVYYAHGAGWAQEEPTIQEMARQGRRAFSMELVGDRESDPRFTIGHAALGDIDSLQHVSEAQVAAVLDQLDTIVPRQQMREAATLLGVIAERSVHDSHAGRIDAVFQSESAGHGLVAMYASPDSFRNVVLAFPGSLSGPQRGFIPGKVAKDALVRRRHRPEPSDDFRAEATVGKVEALRMQLVSPGFREDAAALRYSALASMLHTIRQRENAPHITLVAGLDDKIFELEHYLTSLVSSRDVDSIVVVPGGHAIGGRREVMASILAQLDAPASPDGPLATRIVLPRDISPERAEGIFALADEVDKRTATLTD